MKDGETAALCGWQTTVCVCVCVNSIKQDDFSPLKKCQMRLRKPRKHINPWCPFWPRARQFTESSPGAEGGRWWILICHPRSCNSKSHFPAWCWQASKTKHDWQACRPPPATARTRLLRHLFVSGAIRYRLFPVDLKILKDLVLSPPVSSLVTFSLCNLCIGHEAPQTWNWCIYARNYWTQPPQIRHQKGAGGRGYKRFWLNILAA